MQGSASGKSTARRAPASGSNSPNANLGDAACKSRFGSCAASPLGLFIGSTGGSDSLGYLRRQFASNINEGIARSRRSLRAPDQALESEDEGIYLRRTKRYLYCRSAENFENVQRRRAVCRRDGGPGKERIVRR